MQHGAQDLQRIFDEDLADEQLRNSHALRRRGHQDGPDSTRLPRVGAPQEEELLERLVEVLTRVGDGRAR